MTTDKATRDKIAAGKVSLDELERLGRWANDHIERFERMARQSLPEILALLPADVDESTRAVLVRLRLETANDERMTIDSINAFLSVFESLRDAMPDYPARCRAAIRRAEKQNFKRQYPRVIP